MYYSLRRAIIATMLRTASCFVFSPHVQIGPCCQRSVIRCNTHGVSSKTVESDPRANCYVELELLGDHDVRRAFNSDQHVLHFCGITATSVCIVLVLRLGTGVSIQLCNHKYAKISTVPCPQQPQHQWNRFGSGNIGVRSRAATQRRSDNGGISSKPQTLIP